MEEFLKLSEDKQQVIDQNGSVVYIATEKDGKTVYVDAGPSLEGRVCVEFKMESKKVCIDWNGPKCVSWGGIDVQLCAKWENQ